MIYFQSWPKICFGVLVLIMIQQIALTDAEAKISRSSQLNEPKDLQDKDCSLNGIYDASKQNCKCDPGWKGDMCSILSLAPAPPPKFPSRGIVPGVAVPDVPTWGGGATFEGGKWHLLVGSLAINKHNNSLAGYPCNSKIIRVISDGPDPLGPYRVAETVFPRSSWEPGLAKNPSTGELIVMFFGNITNPPDIESPSCVDAKEFNQDYNLTSMNTFISVSKSGSIQGPWSKPQMVKGMVNQPQLRGVSGYDWNCASGNPSPAFHPNGTLYAAMRHNPCWKGFQTREHIGIWRADNGWDGEWTSITNQPIFGWGGGSVKECTDDVKCPSHEDPHLWWDERGAHLMTHHQNNQAIHELRGAYGWSKDGFNWNYATGPLLSNSSLWDMDFKWTNGTTRKMVRRQRPSFVRDPTTGKITHLINGADFDAHPSPTPGFWCEGCHWGSGVTLIQPLM